MLQTVILTFTEHRLSMFCQGKEQTGISDQAGCGETAQLGKCWDPHYTCKTWVWQFTSAIQVLGGRQGQVIPWSS